ncbi:hypothetical protein V1522DRAFT_406108 [Lipomyces starkeyi]
MNFALTFLDVDPTLPSLWSHYLQQHLPHLRVPRHLYPQVLTASVTSPPPNLAFDCIVSPGNSFARMDGGLDLSISRLFAGSRTRSSGTTSLTAVLKYVQKAHHERWKGLQPVGSCYIIDMLPFLLSNDTVTDNYSGDSQPETNTFGCRYIAHAPTMRVPSVLGRAEVVYDCMWAILNEIYNHNKAIDSASSSCRETTEHTKIEKVVISGLGTGTGELSRDMCAKLMVLAYVHFLDAVEKGEDCAGEWSWQRAREWDRIITNNVTQR